MRLTTPATLGLVSVAKADTLPCDPSTFSSIPSTTLVSVDFLPQGTNITLPHSRSLCANYGLYATATTDMCRVMANVSLVPGSSIRMDAWLPTQTWNNRFLATGDGGIGGCIDYSALQMGAQLGFASFGTNAGHDGDSGYEFFLNQPEVIRDFGERAIHVEAEWGKQVIELFYGRKQERSYYHGCSTGGRQGLQNAQMWPEDFDGVLAGAPGIDWLRIVASKGVLSHRIGWPDLASPRYVRPEQWKAIVEHQIRLFDPMDGVVDGVIDDPTMFRYDPALAACGRGGLNESVCLSPEQVPSVRAAYESIADTKGKIVYPGFGVGADTSVFSANQMNGTARLSYRVLDDFWKGAVYNDSSWSSVNFTLEDMDFAVDLNPGGVGFTNTDYSVAKEQGRKIMVYHGHYDETITSVLSAEWYAKVMATTGLTLEEMHEFYRLFYIPGMNHCAGGPGAVNVGQRYPLDPKKLDAEHNVLLALVDWVEKGKKPDAIVGTKYTAGSVTQPILAERKHCPYPQRSKWNGRDDSKLSTSWDCV